jgi:transposase
MAVDKSEAQGTNKPKGTPGSSDRAVPNPEVVARATRRTFSAEYKLRILEEADACTPAERGALLRREGLYASHLTHWRKQREKGSLAALAPQKRGPKKDPDQSKSRRIAELEREVERLRARLEKAETVIEVQKKISDLLGFPAQEKSSGRSS